MNGSPRPAEPRYPLSVDLDFLPADKTGLGAPLGLMAAPGTRGALAGDLAELRGAHQVELLVSLLEEHELTTRGIPRLVEEASAAALDLLRFPIRDFGAPASPADLFPVVDRILSFTARRRAVVVHCWAGLGRSGLVAASCVAARGMDADEAIALVRRHRRFAVQNTRQEQFVRDFAAAFRAR